MGELFNTVFTRSEQLFDREYTKPTRISLWPATRERLGGIIVGNGLSIDNDGVLTVDFTGLFKSYPSKYEFPNIGESGYFYIDKSNGDVFLWGTDGSYYTSIGVANKDTIYGGDSLNG